MFTPEPTKSQCADSTTWYAKKPRKTCEWVAKKTKNCKKKDEWKVKAEDACPATCDATCETTCADSTTWYAKKTKKTCEWVAKKTKNCKKKDEFKVKAEDACPVTCDACETACADSTTWYYKKENKNCEEWVAENTYKRCRHNKYSDEAGVSPLEACPVSCGACDLFS